EERVAVAPVRDAEEHLEALHNSLESVHTRVTEAEIQVKSVFSVIKDRQVSVLPMLNLIMGLDDPLPFSIALLKCDLKGTYSNKSHPTGDFDIKFDDYQNVDSEAEDEDDIWDPDDDDVVAK
ncbi:hypothetical protein CVT26_003876, partial [Gymnopilus dilepis]